MRKHRWSNDDMLYLKENAGRLTTKEICSHLGRTKKSVQAKAARMGLSLKGYDKVVKCYECSSDVMVPAPSNGNIRCKTCKERHRAEYTYNYYREEHNEQNFDGNRFKVMERDGFMCRVCGSEESLVVHHINGISFHNSDNPDNRLENLTTLCRSCHMYYHVFIERRESVI